MVILWLTNSSAMPPMCYSQVKRVWLNCNPNQGTATVPKQKPKVFTNMSKPLPSGTAFSLSQTMWKKFCADLHRIQSHWNPILQHSLYQENMPACCSPLSAHTQSQWDLGAPSNKSVQEFLTVPFPAPLSWHRFSKPAKQFVWLSLQWTPWVKMTTQICDLREK